MTQDPDVGRVLHRILMIAMATAPALAACSSTPAHADAGPSTNRCEARILDASITDSDAGTECYAYERYGCGLPAAVRPVDAGCSFALTDCKKLCRGFGAFECHADDASCVNGRVVDSGVTLLCDFCSSSAGRRPPGLCTAEPLSATSRLGDFFARVARLEAAAVPAFRALGHALRQMGAPRELVGQAHDAARDEVRHARLMRRLAARHGARPAPVRLVGQPTPGLETLATRNAIEGMVRETLGALVASWQARQACDAATRAALREVAADETRHATLSWEIGQWAASQLDAAANLRVAAAARREARRLADDIAEPHSALVRGAGLPTRAGQSALLGGLERELWAPWWQSAPAM